MIKMGGWNDEGMEENGKPKKQASKHVLSKVAREEQIGREKRKTKSSELR